MDNLLPAQKEFISSSNKLILLIGGYAAGKTEALLNKVIMNQDKNFCFVSLNNCLSLAIRERVKNLNDIFPRNLTLKNIDSIKNNKVVYDYIIVDDFGELENDESQSIYNKLISFADNLVFTCTPHYQPPLENHFCYQLSCKEYCKTIHFALTDNHYIPTNYIKNLSTIPEHKNYIKGNFCEE